MWRHQIYGARLQAALQQLRRYGAEASVTTSTISAQIAESMASPGTRLTKLPDDVLAALNVIAANTNQKDVRQRGYRLTDELKHLSRTKHRGGSHPNLHDEEPTTNPKRTSRGNRRQVQRRALVGLSQHSAIFVDDENPPSIDAWAESSGPQLAVLDSTCALGEQEAAVAARSALYEQGNAVAYAVSRMPACYAALRRVFEEVKRAAPEGWRPTNVLDFGAGPGTATWAIHEAWPAAAGQKDPIKVLAVEPSEHMAWIGNSIQQQYQERYHNWIDEQRAEGAVEGERVGDGGLLQNDLEIEGSLAPSSSASSPLSPPPSIRWLSRLPPQQARGSGKHDVVVAGYVLGELYNDSERRRKVVDLWERSGKFLILIEPGTPSGAAAILAARSAILERYSGAVHVVAPCPHDGPCPLEGRRAWCHFQQRFERPGVLRRAKSAATGMPARTHQDERFSYVVLQKGPRRSEPLVSVRVAGVTPPSLEEEEEGWIPERLLDGLVSAGLEERSQLQGGEGGEVDGETFDGEFSSDKEIASSKGHDNNKSNKRAASEELKRLLLDSIASAESDDEDGEPLDADLLQLLEEAAALESHSEEESHGEEESDNEGTASPIDRSHTRRRSSKTSKSSKYSEDNETMALDYGESGEKAQAAAKAASVTWSRLLRPPRKRSGHIILDVCSAMDADGQYLGGTKGALLRQIVSKANATRASGGTAPFKLARRVRWGDLWPGDYQQRMGAAEPPDSPV